MDQPELRKLFDSPDEWHQDTFVETKWGVIDVMSGGGVFGAISGSAVGAQYGQEMGDLGAVAIFGLIGALVGVVGGALLGILIGGVGELICSRFGLDRRLRSKLGGSLNTFTGRLLYGGLLGAAGGAIMLGLVLGIYGGHGELIDSVVIGAVFWATWGTIGGAINWILNRARLTDSVGGGVVIGGGIAAMVGIILGIISSVMAGISVGIVMAMMMTVLGIGSGATTRVMRREKIGQ